MSILESILRGLQDFAESDTAKRMMQQAEQRKAAEIERTTGKNGLRCTITSLQNYGYGVKSEGSVKNIGQSTYSLIVVNVVFKDVNGNTVDKHETYVSTGVKLSPGEAMPFRVFSHAKDIHSANAYISKCEDSL